MVCLYQQTRGKRRFHFSPARRPVEALWRSPPRPTARKGLLSLPARGLPVRSGGSSRGLGIKAGTGSAAADPPTSLAAKTGSSRLSGSAAGIEARSVVRPASGSSPVCVSARVGSKLRLVLRAPRWARRRAARSSSSWRSRASARVSPNRSGKMRPVSRCATAASA